jgi:hypothetical protein
LPIGQRGLFWRVAAQFLSLFRSRP